MKRYFPFALVFLIGAGAVAGGTLLYRVKRAELAAAAAMVATKSDKGAVGADPAHIRGEVIAPVTLEEFGDFQCPPCATVAGGLSKIEREYGAKLRVIFREFPLAMHAHAQEAARAAEAAGAQGKFWEMHDLLFGNQTAWSSAPNVDESFKEYARTLALDLDRFERDREGEKIKDRIKLDQKRGDSLGVTSTPTLFLNGRLLPPASFNDAGLRAAIDAALGSKPASP